MKTETIYYDTELVTCEPPHRIAWIKNKPKFDYSKLIEPKPKAEKKSDVFRGMVIPTIGILGF